MKKLGNAVILVVNANHLFPKVVVKALTGDMVYVNSLTALTNEFESGDLIVEPADTGWGTDYNLLTVSDPVSGARIVLEYQGAITNQTTTTTTTTVAPTTTTTTTTTAH